MLVDQIKSDLTAALKAGEGLRVSVLRMLVSEINYKQIDVQREIADADVMAVLAREVKKRREAIESYTAAGRLQQADSERVEMEILQSYLPKMMTEAEIEAELAEVKEIEGVTEFGKVMRVVAPRFSGRAEGAVVASVVKKKLGMV